MNLHAISHQILEVPNPRDKNRYHIVSIDDSIQLKIDNP